MIQNDVEKELISLQGELTSIIWQLRWLRRKAYLTGAHFPLKQIENVCNAIDILESEINRLGDDVQLIIGG